MHASVPINGYSIVCAEIATGLGMPHNLKPRKVRSQMHATKSTLDITD